LTITDFEDDKIDLDKRKIVIVSGRVHPGESNGSFLVQGFINELLSGSEEAVELRKK